MQKFLISITVFLLFLTPVFAEDYLIPNPPGPVSVVNGYEGSDEHSGEKGKYSLDLQLRDNSQPTSGSFGAQCYTLGTPILAMRAGTIIDVRRPTGGALNGSYGHMVRVGYEDGSYTWYAHMLENTIAVQMGEAVRAGQILGLMGATGFTVGNNCYWENEIGSQVNNYAPHIHIETNTSGGLAVLQEPFVGQERYSNISETTYISTTQMIDPNNHWGKFGDKVPYRFPEGYEPSNTYYNPIRIESFSPSMATRGEREIFTITGNDLPEDMDVELRHCEDFEWLSRKSNEQQFSCIPDPIDGQGVLPGWVSFMPDGPIDYEFHLIIQDQPEGISPKVHDLEIQADNKSKKAQFTLWGEDLPGDLKPDIEDCSDLEYQTSFAEQMSFSCRLPDVIENKNGKLVNGIHTFHTNLTSASTGFSYLVSFTVDYQVIVDSLSPSMAAYDQETTFEITGKNLHLATAFWIENCSDLRALDHTETLLKLTCTPQQPYQNYGLFVPDELEIDLYQVVLKDQPDGHVIFNGQVAVGQTAKNEAIVYDFQEWQTQDPVELPDTHDELIEHVISVNGGYNDFFLESVGWKKTFTYEGLSTYKPIECISDLSGRKAHWNMEPGCLQQ